MKTQVAEIIIAILPIIIEIVFFIFEHLHKRTSHKISWSSNKKFNKITFNIKQQNIKTVINSCLMESESNSNDFIIALELYTKLLNDALTEAYPNFQFNISIKKVNNNAINTIISTDNNIELNNTKCLIKDNTEFNSIINEHHQFFFVTDIQAFNNSVLKYKSSNKNWANEYKTSIVFPIDNNNLMEGKPIGFICVTSPQKLNNTKINNQIMKLIKSTSNDLYKLLVTS